MVDEVADLIGSPGTSDPETVTKETIAEKEVVEPETEFDYSNNGIAEDVEAEQAEFDEEDAEEAKKGGSISKNKFVKGVMKSLKKAAEGTQQETSNVANITDIPIGGRQSFVNNWKQGVKDLGNEYYAKQMHDLANTVQPTNVPIKTGLETAGKGREVRQANRQARRATKDFRNAFGDMAAGYFGAPGVPNYLQMLNVVDPSKMPQGQMPPGVTMPGIDFQYKKGPWWTGKREWSAKGVPIGMMPGFGNMQGNMPGYNQGSWNSSWNTGWQKTKVAGTRERVIKAINSAADPTKVNNVELNNNPVKTSNTEWMGENDYRFPETWTPEMLAMDKARNPEKYPETNKPWSFFTDPKGMVYNYNNLEGIDPATGLPLMDADGTPILDEDGKKVRKEWTDNAYYADRIPSSPYSDLLEDEYTKAHNIKKFTDYTPEQQAQLQDYDQSSYLTRDKLGNEYSTILPSYSGTSDYQKQVIDPAEEAMKPWFANRDFQDEQWKRFSPHTYEEEDGGFVDPSQMQPGVLQKFMGGGDDFISPMVQYQNNDLATKNVNDPYYEQGGLIKAFDGLQYQSAAEEAFGSNPAANREAYNKAVANGKTNDSSYSPSTNYGALIGANINNNQNNNTGNGYQAGDQIRSDGSVWRGNTQISDGKGSIWENNSNRSNTGYNNYIQPKTAPITAPSIGRQILNLVNPFKKDDGDFTWASQRGPITGTNGQPFNPATMGANNLSGYVQDWEGTKNPWYRGGKETFKLTNRYVGTDGQPGTTTNKPGTGTGAGVGVYAPGYGVNANMKPGTTPTPGVPGAPGTNGTSSGDYSSFKNSTQRKIARHERRAAAGEARGRAAFPEDYIDGPSNPDNSANESDILYPLEQMSAEEKRLTDLQSKRPSEPFSSQQYLAKDYGDIGSELGPDFEKFMATNPSKEDIDKQVGWSLGDRNRAIDNNQKYLIDQEQRDINKQSLQNRNIGLAYGGYVPSFDPGGQFTGVGPFDPNKNLVSDGCSDDDKKDPNSPCYIPAFARPGATIQEMMGINTTTEKPEDFEVNYDLHKAKTIDTNAIANIGALGSAGLQWNNNRKDSNYTDEWEFNNLTADNRDPGASYVDNAGGYSGLSGRNMEVSSNPYIVGQAGFGAKFGGTPNYKEGGTYNMTKNELMQFMAQGGQIEFI